MIQLLQTVFFLGAMTVGAFLFGLGYYAGRTAARHRDHREPLARPWMQTHDVRYDEGDRSTDRGRYDHDRP